MTNRQDLYSNRQDLYLKNVIISLSYLAKLQLSFHLIYYPGSVNVSLVGLKNVFVQVVYLNQKPKNIHILHQVMCLLRLLIYGSFSSLLPIFLHIIDLWKKLVICPIKFHINLDLADCNLYPVESLNIILFFRQRLDQIQTYFEKKKIVLHR